MQVFTTKDSIIQEAKRIQEDALFSLAGHWIEARWWNYVQLWLGIPTTIIATAAGVSSLSEGQIDPNILFKKDVIVAILSFTVAAMSALITFLDPMKQASKHYNAGISYKALYDEIRIFSNIDCFKNNSIDELEKDLKIYNGKITELNKQTPLIPNRAIKNAKKKICSGYYEYEIDKKVMQDIKSISENK